MLCIYAASAVGIHLHPYAAPAARARGLRLPLLMLASPCTTMALWCSAPAGRMASNVAATAGQEFPLPSCGPTMFPSISQTPPLQQLSESKMLLPPKLESSTSPIWLLTIDFYFVPGPVHQEQVQTLILCEEVLTFCKSSGIWRILILTMLIMFTMFMTLSRQSKKSSGNCWSRKDYW